MTFGPYINQPISAIIDEDPLFLEWAIGNVVDFKLDLEAEHMLSIALNDLRNTDWQFD